MMDSSDLSKSFDEEGNMTWNYCSSKRSTIHDLRPEILEKIFQQLNAKDVKTCRLVCSKWNSEIQAHIPQSLILSVSGIGQPSWLSTTEIGYWGYFQEVGRRLMAYLTLARSTDPTTASNSTSQSNLEFIRKIDQIKSLHLEELPEELYACLLKEHQRKQLQQLKISCKLHQSFIQLVLQPCTNLKVLKISDTALNSCDLEEDWSTIADNGNDNPFLCNLQVLTLFLDYESEHWTKLLVDGKEVQLNSKNITFLLRHITSLRMKILQIEFYTTLTGITCVGRSAYRFENLDLQTFICKNCLQLEQLDLDIPISMSKKLGLLADFKRPTVPNSIKSINLTITTGRTGNYEEYEEFGMTFTNTELLEFDETFYDNHAEESNFYWDALSLAQTQLVKFDVRLVHLDLEASVMENIYKILQNNMNTLEKLSFGFWIENIWQDVQINGMHFQQATKLSSLQLCAVITGDPMPMPAGPTAGDICKIINLHLLPKTITSLKLFNIKMEREGFVQILANLTSLKNFSYIFRFSYLVDLGQLENFTPIVDGLVKQCTSYLELGQFGNFTDKSLQELLKSFEGNYREDMHGDGGVLKISNLIDCDNPWVSNWDTSI